MTSVFGLNTEQGVRCLDSSAKRGRDVSGKLLRVDLFTELNSVLRRRLEGGSQLSDLEKVKSGSSTLFLGSSVAQIASNVSAPPSAPAPFTGDRYRSLPHNLRDVKPVSSLKKTSVVSSGSNFAQQETLVSRLSRQFSTSCHVTAKNADRSQQRYVRKFPNPQ